LSVNGISRLMGSVCLGPKVIQLSSAHCTTLSSYNFLEWMISKIVSAHLWHHCNIVQIIYIYIYLVHQWSRLRGSEMEDLTNSIISTLCQSHGFDLFCFVFIGHGFGKGPGYLIGSDGQVHSIILALPKLTLPNLI
jgi:hypothetical protein